MDRPRLQWLPVLVLVVTVLYTISVYPSLPERMATHWGIDGRPNGWSSREFGAWILPGIMTFMCLLSLVLPKVGAPRDLIVTAIVAFQGVIQYVMLNIARGRAIDMNTVVYVSLGALFCVIGLATPLKMPGRFLWVASGVLTIVAALTAPPPVALMVVLASSIVASLGSIIFRWRQR